MNLLIIGAGQYGMVVREIAQATGRFDKIDFLDDNNAVAIDSTNNISKWVSEYKIAIVAIGKADVREKYLTLLKQCGYELQRSFTLTHIFHLQQRLGVAV